MSKLRDSSGTAVSDKEVVAGVARSHFESLGKGGGRIVMKLV